MDSAWPCKVLHMKGSWFVDAMHMVVALNKGTPI